MPTSPTEPAAGAGTLLVFVGEDGAPGCWLRPGGGGADYGVAADGVPAAARTVLAVPGDGVAVHWIELASGLAPAQAAAAARLMLADASAEPIGEMHVALGRPERGLTPVALVPARRMEAWLAAAAAARIEPDAALPSPLLLAAPESGFVRRDAGGLFDYRGAAAAFTMEPELAAAVIGEAEVETLDEAAFEAGLPAVLAEPPLDLLQGPYARRRRWQPQGRRLRRVAALALALAALTLAVQIATILAFTFAADRARAEAEALAAEAAPGAGGASFGASAEVLFAAVRATPNVELARLEYRADGSLAATLLIDSPASLAALQQRIEAGGLAAEPGARGNAGGRPTAELTVRPA